MMKVKLRFGDILKIGGATVKLEERSGQLACLVIDAPRPVEVRLTRAERDDARNHQNGARNS